MAGAAGGLVCFYVLLLLLLLCVILLHLARLPDLNALDVFVFVCASFMDVWPLKRAT